MKYIYLFFLVSSLHGSCTLSHSLAPHEIYKSTKFNQDARFKAKAFIDVLLKYETILTAHIFLQIFINTSPVSLYLQSKDMNVIQVYTMVIHSISVLSEESRNFDKVVDTSDITNIYRLG